MARIKYETVVSYQDGWKKSGMSQNRKDALVALSNILMHKAIDNNHEIDDITLLYPEDCDDYDAFTDLAFAFDAFVSIRDEGGCKMHGWGMNKPIDVE